MLTLGRTRSHARTVVQETGGGGWVMDPLWVFDMLQYFETILPALGSF